MLSTASQKTTARPDQMQQPAESACSFLHGFRIELFELVERPLFSTGHLVEHGYGLGSRVLA
eukprot:3933140-Rhodomonas_salina.1